MERRQNRTARPLAAVLALLLAIAVLGTTPMAMSKYKSTGIGTAGARIAKFAPVFTAPSVGGGTYLFTGTGSATFSGFSVTNNGETLVTFTATPMLNTPAGENDRPATYSLGTYGYTGGRTALTSSYVNAVTVGTASNVAMHGGTASLGSTSIQGYGSVAGVYGANASTHNRDMAARWVTYRVNFDCVANQVD